MYVDDVLIWGSDHNETVEVINFIGFRFMLRDLGTSRYFLSVETARLDEEWCYAKRKYTLYLLSAYGMLRAKLATTPMDASQKLSKEDINQLSDPTFYRQLVGKLIYLTLIKPAISYVMNLLSQFMSKPANSHLKTTYRLLKCLKTPLSRRLLLKSSREMKLQAFSCSYWGSSVFSLLW